MPSHSDSASATWPIDWPVMPATRRMPSLCRAWAIACATFMRPFHCSDSTASLRDAVDVLELFAAERPGAGGRDIGRDLRRIGGAGDDAADHRLGGEPAHRQLEQAVAARLRIGAQGFDLLRGSVGLKARLEALRLGE